MQNNIIYGKHSTVEALKLKKVQKLYLQEDLKNNSFDEIKKLSHKQKLTINFVPKSKLDKLTNKANHQGVVGIYSDYEFKDLNSILKKIENKENATILILDHLEDPHNFGSILRTADATSVDAIIIPKDRAVGITPVVAKTSTGALEYLDIARVVNLKQAVSKLKEHGFWIFGTDMNGTSMVDWNVQGKVALIIGNEGKGMSSLLRKEVDEMITIPMDGHVQSLNASVAAGVLMYQIFQKRL